MSCPTFIDITEVEQLVELREYLNKKGENISKEIDIDNVNWYENLMEIIDASQKIINEAAEPVQDYEGLLYCLVSLVAYVPCPGKDLIKIQKFCNALSNEENQQPGKHCESRLRTLQTLYKILPAVGPLRYVVYKAMLGIALAIPNMNCIITDINKLSKLFADWSINIDDCREIYLLLHKGWLKANNAVQAMKTMLAYLSTFEANESKVASKEAEKCIVIMINDPKQYLMDHLLSLEPVKALKGALIYELLNIFIHKRFSDYIDFYNLHKEQIESYKLNHERNSKKMRVLTLMHIGEHHRIVDYETLQNELQLDSTEVENFVIEATACRAINAKIDEMNKQITINSTVPRSFEINQWQSLRSQLHDWRNQLQLVRKFIPMKKEKRAKKLTAGHY